MQPRQYSMVWMAWCTMVSPKSNCQGRKPDSGNEAGRGACRGLSAGTNGHLDPEPLVLNSWWRHFGGAIPGNPAWLGPKLGAPLSSKHYIVMNYFLMRLFSTHLLFLPTRLSAPEWGACWAKSCLAALFWLDFYLVGPESRAPCSQSQEGRKGSSLGWDQATGHQAGNHLEKTKPLQPLLIFPTCGQQVNFLLL